MREVIYTDSGERVKMYVDVYVFHTSEGSSLPLKIRLYNGQTFEIDRIKGVCRAASTKVGGTGMRYSVVIKGVETYLFDEGEGRWFVEARREAFGR